MKMQAVIVLIKTLTVQVVLKSMLVAVQAKAIFHSILNINSTIKSRIQHEAISGHLENKAVNGIQDECF